MLPNLASAFICTGNRRSIAIACLLPHNQDHSLHVAFLPFHRFSFLFFVWYWRPWFAGCFTQVVEQSSSRVRSQVAVLLETSAHSSVRSEHLKSLDQRYCTLASSFGKSTCSILVGGVLETFRVCTGLPQECSWLGWNKWQCVSPLLDRPVKPVDNILVGHLCLSSRIQGVFSSATIEDLVVVLGLTHQHSINPIHVRHARAQ